MDTDPILAAVDALTGPFVASDLDELEVEAGGITVRLAKRRAPAPARRRPRVHRRPPARSASRLPVIGSSPRR